MKEAQDYPDFDDLPPVEGMPQGCVWGIFDVDGKKDRVGTLNFLTPTVIKAAAAEVRDGHSISLNWPLNALNFPGGRPPPIHTVTALKDKFGCHGWDDTIEFNTQVSSQWDSLVHFQHQTSELAYNGVKCTKEGLGSLKSTKDNAHPTLDHWHQKGGMVARAVLLDHKRYVQEKLGREDCSAFDGMRISPEELEAVAAWQEVEFKPADVLIVRTGFTESVTAPIEGEMAKMVNGQFSGVAGTLESAKWIWNKRFSAVAGDALAFEAYPPLKEDGAQGQITDLVLHPWMLAMFGTSIGELWDLKELSDYCKKVGRYSFMLTSAPLNHPGLVGSPPNALAIF